MGRGRSNEVHQSTVLLNGKQAEDEMKKLSARADDFGKKKREAFEKNDLTAYKKWDAELRNVNKQMKNMKLETQSVEAVLKNLNGASMDDIRRAATKLTNELKKMKQTDPGFKEKTAQAKLLNERYAQMNREIRGVRTSSKGMFGNMADGFNKYFGMITAFAASFTGIVLGFRQAQSAANDFEEKVDNLSALTGLLGDELEWLSQKAKETSVGMTADGVRVKQSANDIVDAYTLIGSQRPELLKNKEALHEVTIAAITLSEAGKMKLEPAAIALTNTLNQMNLASNESGRVINAIAAGSQAGAGNIEYISQAMEKAGTSASLLGISVEQMIGLIETAAPKFNEARMAGNSLDKVLLKMREGGIGMANGTFDMNRALDELRERMANGETAGKMFGVEHAKMIEVLVQGQSEFNRYTDAVTGTDKAIEQAVTNTSNNATKLAQAKNKLQLRLIEFGEMIAPTFTFSTNMVNKLIKLIMQLIDFTQKYGTSMLTAASAIAAYTIAVNAATIAFKAKYYWLVLVEKAQKLLNTTVKMNPYAALIAVGAGLITFLISVTKRTNEAAAAQKKYNEYLAETETLIEQTSNIEERAATIDKMNKTQLERFKADAEAELSRFEELEDKKLLAAQNYQDEIVLLEKYISNNAKTEEERRAMYANKYVTQRRDEAFEKLQEISNFIDSNKTKLKGFILEADSALSGFGSSGGGSESERISSYIQSNQTAFQQWKQRGEERLRILGLLNTEIEQAMRIVDRMPDEENMPDVSLDELFNIQRTKLKQQYANGEIDLQTYHHTLESMEVAHLMTMIELRKATGEDYTELENQLLEIRIKNNEAEAESKKAFNTELGNIAIQSAQNISDAIFAINADRIEAELDAQLSVLDRQRDAELKNKNLTEAQKDAIDDKYRKKEAALRTAAWKKQQKAAISQAIINGALAITKTFADYGFTPLGWAAAAGQAISTGTQIAVISSQKPPQFKRGGYTDQSFSNSTVAGIVHANEFVGNAMATANPTVRPVFDLINYAQQNGTISSLNLPQAIAASNSFAAQTATSNPSFNYNIDASMMMAAVAEFKSVINDLVKEGIEAKLVYQDYKRMADKETSAINRTQ